MPVDVLGWQSIKEENSHYSTLLCLLSAHALQSRSIPGTIPHQSMKTMEGTAPKAKDLLSGFAQKKKVAPV